MYYLVVIIVGVYLVRELGNAIIYAKAMTEYELVNRKDNEIRSMYNSIIDEIVELREAIMLGEIKNSIIELMDIIHGINRLIIIIIKHLIPCLKDRYIIYIPVYYINPIVGKKLASRKKHHNCIRNEPHCAKKNHICDYQKN